VPSFHHKEAAARAAEIVALNETINGLADFGKAQPASAPLRSALDRLRNPLTDRIVSLLTSTPEDIAMQHFTDLIPPGSIKTLFVHDYDAMAGWTEKQSRAIGKVLDGIDALPEPLAAQVLLERLQLLPAPRRAEIAALIAGA
jgi:hypothetical protein